MCVREYSQVKWGLDMKSISDGGIWVLRSASVCVCVGGGECKFNLWVLRSVGGV